MKVKDLIEQLKSMNPEAEIRLATQPEYPFENSVSDVYETEDESKVFICEGSQIGYLDEEVTNNIW